MLGLAEDALPEPDAWSAEVDLLLLLAEDLLTAPVDLVLECGAGASTVVLAAALRRNGMGRLITLEHDEGHAEATSRRLGRLGLDGLVEMRRVDLVPVTWSDGQGRFYNLSGVPETGVGMILVDGPPADSGPNARAPAGPLLLPRLMPGGRLYLDDLGRRDELAAFQSWIRMFGAYRMRLIRTARGCGRLERPA